MKQNIVINYLSRSWLVLVFSIFFGVLLTGVDAYWGPRIDDNREKATLSRVPDVIFADPKIKMTEPEALQIKTLFVSVEAGGGEKSYKVYSVGNQKNDLLGWAIKAGGRGYADNIELLVGLGPDAEKIKGISILEQKETPGLGTKIAEKKFLNQFIDKTTESRFKAVRKQRQSVQDIIAVTGATISSKSVCDIVSGTVTDVKKQLRRPNVLNKSKREKK